MNIRTSAFRGLATLSLAALGLAACEGKDTINIPEQVNPVEVTVAPTQVTLVVGQKTALAAVVKNSTNQAVTWACAPTTVVTLSGTEATAVAPGSAVCTATAAADASAKGVVSITVTAPVITMSVLPTTATINSVAPGNTIQLAANVSGSSNQNVTWASNATGVATVSTTGLVTAVAPGTAVVTATSAADANVKASSVITVSAPVVPAVVITLQPATASTTIGGTVQLVPNVTGSTNTNVTYRSSDALVATVTTGGLVTGVKGGTAVITAIAAADTTKKATAVITVAGAAPAASISIASVVDHNEGAPVDPANIEEQIDVTVNVSAVPENGVRAVVVYVDDKQVCRQDFTTDLGTTQGVATINCPVNTAEYDASYDPKFVNGQHTISAKALKLNGDVITTATFCPVGTSCKVMFDNHDFIGHVAASFENTVGSWHGGEVTAHVELVKFSTEAITDFTAHFESSCDSNDNGDPNSGTSFDLAFANGEWTGTIEPSGTFDDACINAGSWDYANGDNEHEWVHSAPFQLDNEAPYIYTAPSVGSGLYYNDAKTFSTEAEDYGVGGEDAFTVMEIRGQMTKTGTAGVESITTAGLTETPLNTGYKVYVYAKDLLGNEAWYGPWGNFGIDFTEPTVTFKVTYDTTGTPAIATGGTKNVLNYPITFTATYIDAATPPAGPAGFNPNPFSYSITQYTGSGTSTTSSSTNTTFAIGASQWNGYYVVNARVTDAAGNYVDMAPFTILVDSIPPYIGTLTVPSVLTGGTAFTMSAQVTDNVDLGAGWATIGYNNTTAGMNYWLVQQETELGTYGLPLTTSIQFGTVTIPSVIRSITTVDPATNKAGAGSVVYTAKTAEYAILDVAGVQIPTLCPAVPAADDATTLNCRVRTADIGPAYNVGNPTGTTWSGSITGLLGIGDATGATGFKMDAGTGAIDATATGQAQTFNNPFSAVYFYGIDATGRAHYLGTGSVSVTDDTLLQIRTWRYTLASSWSSAYAKYTGGVFALVMGTNGDVLVTVTEAHP